MFLSFNYGSKGGAKLKRMLEGGEQQEQNGIQPKLSHCLPSCLHVRSECISSECDGLGLNPTSAS